MIVRDMYEKVRKDRRPKWDRTIWYWSAVAAVMVVALAIPIVSMARHQYRFHGFLQDVSSSSLHARIGAVTCSVDGKTDTVTTEELSKLLVLLTDGGCGKREKQLPSYDSFRIDFPDGAVLELWRGEIKDAYTKEMLPALIVAFDNKEGERYSYLTYKISVKNLQGILPDVAREWIARNSE